MSVNDAAKALGVAKPGQCDAITDATKKAECQKQVDAAAAKAITEAQAKADAAYKPKEYVSRKSGSGSGLICDMDGYV